MKKQKNDKKKNKIKKSSLKINFSLVLGWIFILSLIVTPILTIVIVLWENLS